MCLNSPSHGLALKKRFFTKRMQNYYFSLEFPNLVVRNLKKRDFIIKK